MNNNRIDEIEKFYKPMKIIQKIINYLFWISAAISIILLFKNFIPWKIIQNIVSIIFIISVIIHISLSLIIRYSLFPKAERARRKQLMSDSFSVPLISETTVNYYNNEFPPSIERLTTNIFENTLFTMVITQKMLLRKRLLIVIYGLIFVIALYWRSTDLGLIILITQLFFSCDILEEWLRLEWLHKETEGFYNTIYQIFLQKTDINTPSGLAATLEIITSYETAKGISGIILSGSIFNECNPSISSEWQKIKEKLGINIVVEEITK